MQKIDINAQDCAYMANRIIERCDILAKISAHTHQLTRLYLSKQHAKTNGQVAMWMQQAGMQVWQDSIGNICGRYEGEDSGMPALLLGSHLDTVKNAGRYDGMLGVLAAIEVVAFFNKNNLRLKMAIEIVGFAEEEGARFGLSLLGSYGFSGHWQPEWLEYQDENKKTVKQAMIDFGIDWHKVDAAKRPVDSILAYLELHIEQGPCLEKEQLAVGVVTAINGMRRLNVEFKGVTGHAGTVPMGQRQDALNGAAEWIFAVEKDTIEAGNHLVSTIGKIETVPNAGNAIISDARLTLDIRGTKDQDIDDLMHSLLKQGQKIAAKRGLTFSFQQCYSIAATPCDETLQNCLADAVQKIQGRSFSLPSGAGHDAIALSANWPTAMLFLRCKNGISHHPNEEVAEQDVAIAMQIFIEAVMNINQLYLTD